VKLTKAFFEEVRTLILSSRATVARGVDLVQVHTNFEIGRRIVEQEQKGKGRAAYGEQVVLALSEKLTSEFGAGFSKRNLELMRKFFFDYSGRASPIAQTVSAQLDDTIKAQSAIAQSRAKSPRASKAIQTANENSDQLKNTEPFETREITQALSGQFKSLPQSTKRPFTLGWSHYTFLLGVKNPEERSFYEIEATAQGWTVRELKRQFDASLYERLALSRDKTGIRKLAQEGQIVASVNDLFKEPLVLEFLGLDEQTRYSESDLESAILSQIERFLLELGKGFLFESRQRRFTVDGDHFFVDLVFYNRLLRCYVLIDLKLGKLSHQDLGQMQMYVNTFDQQLKTTDENSTIGIILCKQRNKALVEITLPKDANIHAHEYQLYLPSKEELQRKLIEWTTEA
jgi:predicted nuclease of restriction endonuclease-like (RecB) superfamily